MENIFELMKSFEKRNNTSTSLVLHCDGSGSLHEFWDDELIKSFKNIDTLTCFLENAKLKLSKDGRSVSPIVIVE